MNDGWNLSEEFTFLKHLAEKFGSSDFGSRSNPFLISGNFKLVLDIFLNSNSVLISSKNGSLLKGNAKSVFFVLSVMAPTEIDEIELMVC